MEPVKIDAALFEENERLTQRPDDRKYCDVGPLVCESGAELPGVTVAYETWGDLNQARDNAIVVCHALSGDSHAVGWWDRIVGPGKPIDTEHFYVIGTNALGGCQGTTGPASLAPDGKPWGSRFPLITVGDMVEVQLRLADALGIEKLHAVAGGSMGGMQALEWTLRAPGRVGKAWITASSCAHSAMQIGFNEAGRQAVMRDPKWRGGDYPLDDQPVNGLAVARMIGHLTFLSDASFESKFSRRLQDKDRVEHTLGVEYQVESYLKHQADKFTGRFDANSFLYLTRAIDYFERESFEGSQSEYLFTSFTSDWIYPPYQSQKMADLASSAGCKVAWHNIDLPYGHDAFLLDGQLQGELCRHFLRYE